MYYIFLVAFSIFIFSSQTFLPSRCIYSSIGNRILFNVLKFWTSLTNFKFQML